MNMPSEPQPSDLGESVRAVSFTQVKTEPSQPNPPVKAHVTFVLTYYGIGGAEKQLANLVAYRPEYTQNVRVSTITFLPPASQYVQERFEAGGAKNTLIDRSKMPFPLFFLRLLWTMLRTRPTIVSTFLDGSTGTWGRLAAIMTFVPAIVHSDRGLAGDVEPSHKKLRSFLNRHTARFLPNAHAIAGDLVSSGIPADKIRVMWNGVDLSVFSADGSAKAQPSWRSETTGMVLGYLGRFHPAKRIDLLLQAVLKLDMNQRPGLLVLAGDGEDMPRIRAMVEADPWLRDHCRLLGTINDTGSFFTGIDYLVLPSEREGLPNVLLEAMAMSKPVISTRISDIPDLVGDTGLLVDASSLEQLTDALRTMQTMPTEQRLELGRKARRRIEENYSIEAVSKRFWDAHLELVRSKR